jgi:hypothetical protein
MYQVVATKDLPKAIGDGMTVYAVSRNDGKKGKSGIVCVAPSISDSVVAVFSNSSEGRAFIVDAIEGLRSKLISKLYAKQLTVTDDAIGITALQLLAKTETESQRMTKEAIGAWFDADLGGLIGYAIGLKMIGIADDKLAKLVDGYKSKFQTLAQREVSMPVAVKAQLIKAMELLPSDYESIIGEKVVEALTKAEEASETLAAL